MVNNKNNIVVLLIIMMLIVWKCNIQNIIIWSDLRFNKFKYLCYERMLNSKQFHLIWSL